MRSPALRLSDLMQEIVMAQAAEAKPVRIGAAAFDGIDRRGRIDPDGSESGVILSRTSRLN